MTAFWLLSSTANKSSRKEFFDDLTSNSAGCQFGVFFCFFNCSQVCAGFVVLVGVPEDLSYNERESDVFVQWKRKCWRHLVDGHNGPSCIQCPTWSQSNQCATVRIAQESKQFTETLQLQAILENNEDSSTTLRPECFCRKCNFRILTEFEGNQLSQSLI